MPGAIPDKDHKAALYPRTLGEVWAKLQEPDRHHGPFAIVLSLGLPPAGGVLPEASLLCAAELERHQRIREPSSAWAYLASHVALRILVGRALCRQPDKLEFLSPADRTAPPMLRGQAHDGLQISLSHSGSTAAIGLQYVGVVGIDVEEADREFDAVEIAEHFLTPTEIREITALPRQAQATAALQYWCAKEAVLKAAGTGLSIDPRTIAVRWSGEMAKCTLDGVVYELCRLDRHASEKAVGAIACEAPVGEIVETHASFAETLALFRKSVHGPGRA